MPNLIGASNQVRGSDIATKTVTVADGGTGATDAATARINLAIDFYDIAGGTVGKPSASAIIATFVAPRAFTLPSGLTGSYARAGTAATGSATFTLKKNGTSIGSFAFAAAGTSAAFTFASSTNFVAGDVLTVTAPSSQDGTLSDIGFTLKGTY